MGKLITWTATTQAAAHSWWYISTQQASATDGPLVLLTVVATLASVVLAAIHLADIWEK